MALRINCEKCGKEVGVQGGLLFSPRDINGMVDKIHLCQDCYWNIYDIIHAEDK